MKNRFTILTALLTCVLLFAAPAVNAEAAADIWATRLMLPPGTSYTGMQLQLAQSKTCDAPFTAGETLLTATADPAGRICIYLKAETADALEISVSDTDHTELARLTMVPRTYFSYAVFNLNPGQEYTLTVTSASPGTLLAY